jgi:hypothetical protein
MRQISFIILVFILASCGHSSAIDKKLSGCDSLVITFNVADSDSILNMVSTTEKKAIRKMTGYLEQGKAYKSECGFDGNMVFYKMGEILQTVIFQFNKKDCRYLLFEIDNKVMSAPMTDEAASFFKSLSEGKSWY